MPLMVEINNKSEIKHFPLQEHFLHASNTFVYETVSFDKYYSLSVAQERAEKQFKLIYLFLSLLNHSVRTIKTKTFSICYEAIKRHFYTNAISINYDFTHMVGVKLRNYNFVVELSSTESVEMKIDGRKVVPTFVACDQQKSNEEEFVHVESISR